MHRGENEHHTDPQGPRLSGSLRVSLYLSSVSKDPEWSTNPAVEFLNEIVWSYFAASKI